MSGIIAVYALVVAVLIAGNMKPPPERNYSLFQGCLHLACGLSVGLTGLAAGYAIGTVGDTVGWNEDHRLGKNWKTKSTTGGTSIHAAIADLRWYGAHIDLWRSAWAIWVRKLTDQSLWPRANFGVD